MCDLKEIATLRAGLDRLQEEKRKAAAEEEKSRQFKVHKEEKVLRERQALAHAQNANARAKEFLVTSQNKTQNVVAKLKDDRSKTEALKQQLRQLDMNLAKAKEDSLSQAEEMRREVDGMAEDLRGRATQLRKENVEEQTEIMKTKIRDNGFEATAAQLETWEARARGGPGPVGLTPSDMCNADAVLEAGDTAVQKQNVVLQEMEAKDDSRNRKLVHELNDIRVQRKVLAGTKGNED